jgi:hypothetical protein
VKFNEKEFFKLAGEFLMARQYVLNGHKTSNAHNLLVWMEDQRAEMKLLLLTINDPV